MPLQNKEDYLLFVEQLRDDARFIYEYENRPTGMSLQLDEAADSIEQLVEALTESGKF